MYNILEIKEGKYHIIYEHVYSLILLQNLILVRNHIISPELYFISHAENALAFCIPQSECGFIGERFRRLIIQSCGSRSFL